MRLQQDLREFIELLNSNQCAFLVVGGHAVAFHGHPRFTGDIDFLTLPSMDNGAKVIETLRQFGFGGLALTASDFQTPGRVVQIGRPPHRIDLLTGISGVEWPTAWEGRVEGQIDGLPVAFIGLRELLRNKRAAGRPKDLADVAELRAVHAARKRAQRRR